MFFSWNGDWERISVRRASGSLYNKWKSLFCKFSFSSMIVMSNSSKSSALWKWRMLIAPFKFCLTMFSYSPSLSWGGSPWTNCLSRPRIRDMSSPSTCAFCVRKFSKTCAADKGSASWKTSVQLELDLEGDSRAPVQLEELSETKYTIFK